MSEEPENKKSSLESFEEDLYAKKPQNPTFEREELSPKRYDIERDFKSENEEPQADKDAFKKAALRANAGPKQYLGSSPFRKLLFISIALFVIAVGAAAAIVFTKSDVVSTNNIDVSVIGPTSVTAGKKALFQISVTNHNSVTLKDAKLSIILPEGTRDGNDLTKNLTTYNEDLGDITAGGSAHAELEAAFLGDENDQKEMKISIEYGLADSKAIFVKRATYAAKITSAPVAMKVDLVKKSPSDQHVDITVTLDSNSRDTIHNLVLTAAYPSDFSFSQADPVPATNNSAWELGDLSPGESKVITISGILSGVSTEEKIFRFETGISEGMSSSISVPYTIAEAKTTIEAPFVTANVSIGETTKENGAVIEPDHGKFGNLGGSITWENNTNDKLTNLELNLSISGDMIDRSSINAQGGFYRSSDNTLLWNSRTSDDLAVVAANDTGVSSFQIFLKDPALFPQLRNPVVQYDLSVKGNRIGESGVPEALQSYVSKTVKLGTIVDFISNITHFSSPFQNTGPMPPKVGSQTTYTVTWTLKNEWNDVKGAFVSAKLPPYVAWGDQFSPQDVDLSYNSTTGVVTWRVGDLAAGSGFTASPRQVQFQIIFQPSLSQVGASPDLMTGIEFEGEDAFTGANMKISEDSLNTRLKNDPGFESNMDRVVE